MDKPLVVWAGDLHVNLKVALCPPTVNLDEGGTYRASKAQRALWKAWVDAWEQIKRRRRKVVVVFGGEIADKDAKKRVYEVISRNPATIKRMAMDAIKPALDVGNKFIVIRGTPAHSGKSANMDEMIAQDIIGVIGNPHTGTSSWYHMRTDIGGLKFDLAHHAKMGQLPWTERNAANKLAAVAEARYVKWREPFPDFLIRGHVHHVSDSGINYTIRAQTAPCWSLANGYTHRIGKENDKPEIGLLVIDTRTEEPEWIRYETTRPKPIVIR